MNPYLVYWLAGGLASLVVGHGLVRRAGLPPLRSTVALTVLGLAIVVGARGHALALEEAVGLAALWQDPKRLVAGGLRLPGGVVLATLLVPIVAWAARLPGWVLGDIAVIAAGPLYAVGRLACHVSGCCYGTATALPWGIRYDEGSVAHAVHRHRDWLADGATVSLPIHPLALYFSLGALVVSVVAIAARERGARPGLPMLGGLALLGLCFAGVESLRDSFGSPLALYRGETWLAVGAASACAAALRILGDRAETRRWFQSARPSTPDSILEGVRPLPRRF